MRNMPSRGDETSACNMLGLAFWGADARNCRGASSDRRATSLAVGSAALPMRKMPIRDSELPAGDIISCLQQSALRLIRFRMSASTMFFPAKFEFAGAVNVVRPSHDSEQ